MRHRYREYGKETINNDSIASKHDSSQLALAALGWVLGDADRAQRFLDLTGLTPDGLRGAIGEPSTHRAVFDFLAAYEPDMIGAAAALNVDPETLARARRELGA